MALAKQPDASPAIAKGSYMEYTKSIEKTIEAIQESINFIKSNTDKEKVKVRIEKVDKLIKDQKEFLKEKSTQVRNKATSFQATADKYHDLRRAYESKRDALANDEIFTTILSEGANRKLSVVKSVKNIVKGKPAKKTWSPHIEQYQTDPSQEFGDAMDTISKANQDLTKLEEEIHSTKEDPKRLLAAIQVYHDLINKTNNTVLKTAPKVDERVKEWKLYMDTIDAELVDKPILKANPTPLYKAIMDYKEIRAKVGPKVGAKKNSVCAIM